MKKKSLYHLLHVKERQLDKDDFCVLVKDITNGLIYLHNYKPQILHLDLKPKNILIDGHREPRAVIADFGLSVMKKESKRSMEIQPRGTNSYMAPDLLSGKVTEKADIFSFSIIMWEMCYNEEPYEDITYESIIPAVQNGIRPTWKDNDRVPEEVKTLIEKCWAGEPKNRPDAVQILQEIETIHANDSCNFNPVLQ